jgi:DNA-binding SARP family transcriptional activator
LALLVLRRGQVVSPDVAIDVVWPVRRPRDPLAALHNHLFRLRRGLPHDVIESAGDGYRLDPSRIDVDADRLAAAVSRGQQLDPADVATIDEALDRWHGPAYPELDNFDDGRVEAVRLDELRIRAVEVRAESRLAAGHVDGVVVELAALAAEEPLRERPRALLMTALSRSGRTVEALRVYDDFRRLLSDELGIEPAKRVGRRRAGCRFR